MRRPPAIIRYTETIQLGNPKIQHEYSTLLERAGAGLSPAARAGLYLLAPDPPDSRTSDVLCARAPRPCNLTRAPTATTRFASAYLIELARSSLGDYSR